MKASAKAIRKKNYTPEKDKFESYFNQGRKEADRKWVEAIDERIKELEKLVGIPELRLLKNRIRYKW